MNINQLKIIAIVDESKASEIMMQKISDNTFLGEKVIKSVKAISFDLGKDENICKMKALCDKFNVIHQVVKCRVVPVPITPFVLTGVAVSFADSLGYNKVVMPYTKEYRKRYREFYMPSLNLLSNFFVLSTKNNVTLDAPFIDMSEDELLNNENE